MRGASTYVFVLRSMLELDDSTFDFERERLVRTELLQQYAHASAVEQNLLTIWGLVKVINIRSLIARRRRGRRRRRWRRRRYGERRRWRDAAGVGFTLARTGRILRGRFGIRFLVLVFVLVIRERRFHAHL